MRHTRSVPVRRNASRSHAFTLVEVLISTLVIGVGSLSLLVLFAGAARQQQLSATQTAILFESANNAGVLAPRLGGLELNSSAIADSPADFDVDGGEWRLLESSGPDSIPTIKTNQFDGYNFDRPDQFFLSSAPHWMLVEQRTPLTLLAPGNLYSGSSEYDPGASLSSLLQPMNFNGPVQNSPTPIRPFAHNRVDAQSLDGNIILVIDQFRTTGSTTTNPDFIARHEVPTRLIRERIFDQTSLDESGRTVRVATFGLDGDAFPFLPNLRYTRTSPSSTFRTEPRFNIVLETRVDDDVPVAAFTVDPAAISGVDATDLFGPGQQLRLGNTNNLFTASPNTGQGLLFLDNNWSSSIDQTQTVTTSGTEHFFYQLSSIVVRSYAYRSDRLVGLTERIERADPDNAWAQGRPQRGYSVLYRINPDGSSQFATFTYSIRPETQNRIMTGFDSIDFVPIDSAPTVQEVEASSMALTEGRQNSPIVAVELNLGYDQGRRQYYLESARTEDDDWLIRDGAQFLLNVHGDVDSDGLVARGLSARGVDSPVKVISTLEIGARTRGYIDTAPTIQGTAVVSVDDSMNSGGLEIPDPAMTNEIRMLGYAVNQSTRTTERFESYINSIENADGQPLDSARWSLSPESIRIFQVTR